MSVFEGNCWVGPPFPLVLQGSTAFADISPGDVVRARVVKVREKQITG